MKSIHILAINPGSTSTKIGVFKDEECLFEINVSHSAKQLEEFSKIWDQYSFRKEEIVAALEKRNFDISKLDAVVGRGGLIKPIPSGVYCVDQEMIEDARIGFQGQHASNLGCVIAYSIAWENTIPAFIVDPPAVDDLEPLARITGTKEIERGSLLHALNIFATARKYATERGKKIEDINLIVAHMGGGITVAALKKGKAVNVNHGLEEGPMTPERSGQLPLFQFMKLCLSGKHTEAELKKMIVGRGGLMSHFGTNKAYDVEKLAIAGSEKHRMVIEAMAYQVAQEIGARATNLCGEAEAVIITGGIANSKFITEKIAERVKFIAPVVIYPGEAELDALAGGALRVLKGEEQVKHYSKKITKVGVIYWDNLEIFSTAFNIIEERFRKAGYTFRKEESTMNITYFNCNREEENVQKGLDKLRSMNCDIIISVGSQISTRISPFVSKDNIPVVFTGIYSSVVISDFEKEQNNNFYATCYGVDLQEHLKRTVLTVAPEIKKMGMLYRRGELQSEVQFDGVNEFCKSQNIELQSYDIEDVKDLHSAAAFFKHNAAEWVFIGANTVLASASADDLRAITHHFPTTCLLENTVQNGGLVGYVVPWENVCDAAADLSINILEKNRIVKKMVTPSQRMMIANEATAKKLAMKDRLKKIENLKFV